MVGRAVLGRNQERLLANLTLCFHLDLEKFLHYASAAESQTQQRQARKVRGEDEYLS